ncbi:FHA domain-containing protein [Haliangium sp.]|uniref:FHA domain-containing protein n=1 Tax=Haliangium sp. TaxID=2663208 RepID=UPI003D1338F9
MPHVGIVPEQIVSKDDNTKGEAWLVDPWQRGHAVAPGAVIGRDADACAVQVLHPSVSSQHARVERSRSGGWRVVDLGSLNGTSVRGRKVHAAELIDDDQLQVGDIVFRFTSRPGSFAAVPASAGRTVRSSAFDLPIRVTLRGSGGELQLTRRAEGGVAEVGGKRVRLAPLEYGLLRVLIERRQGVAEVSEGFVSSRELVATLAFRSRAADNENVRELVRRVREKLGRLGAGDLIESERGSGYRLGWRIIPADD